MAGEANARPSLARRVSAMSSMNDSEIMDVEGEATKRRPKRRVENIFQSFSDQHNPNVNLSKTETENGICKHMVQVSKFWQSEHDLSRWHQSLRGRSIDQRILDDVGERLNPDWGQERMQALRASQQSQPVGHLLKQKPTAVAQLKELQKTIAPNKAASRRKVDRKNSKLALAAGLMGGSSNNTDQMAKQLVEGILAKHGSLEAAFKAMDFNDSGSLTLMEFSQFVFQMKPEFRGSGFPSAFWSVMDSDRSGAVDTAEFQRKLYPIVKRVQVENRHRRREERQAEREANRLLGMTPNGSPAATPPTAPPTVTPPACEFGAEAGEPRVTSSSSQLTEPRVASQGSDARLVTPGHSDANDSESAHAARGNSPLIQVRTVARVISDESIEESMQQAKTAGEDATAAKDKAAVNEKAAADDAADGGAGAVASPFMKNQSLDQSIKSLEKAAFESIDVLFGEGADTLELTPKKSKSQGRVAPQASDEHDEHDPTSSVTSTHGVVHIRSAHSVSEISVDDSTPATNRLASILDTPSQAAESPMGTWPESAHGEKQFGPLLELSAESQEADSPQSAVSLPLGSSQKLPSVRLPNTMTLFVFRNADPKHCGEPVFFRRWPPASMKDVLTACAAVCRPCICPAEKLLTPELSPLRSIEAIASAGALLLKGQESLDPPALFLKERVLSGSRSLGHLTEVRRNIARYECPQLLHAAAPLRSMGSTSGSISSMPNASTMSLTALHGSPPWVSHGDRPVELTRPIKWKEPPDVSVKLSWGGLMRTTAFKDVSTWGRALDQSRAADRSMDTLPGVHRTRTT